jgi:DNA polymerase-1
MAERSERVVLVDGSAMVYRAFFALPPHLKTKEGIHTNAVFGFATMFKKLFAAKRPTYGAVVFDPPGKTTRDEKYPQYKAQRAPMPEELVEQLPLIDRVVKAYHFPLLRVPGLEADDVIGTLSRLAVEAGHEVIIVSSDKDFAQLIVDGQVKMQDTIRDVIYDEELVRKKWGVKPSQIVDWLALMGDSSDNIPGVDGIGQKGAQQLLEEHGSLHAIFATFDASPDAFKGRTKKALENGRASALLSQELATIDRHAKLPFGLDALTIPVPDPVELNDLFKSLEFYSLLSREDTAAAKAEKVAEGASGGELFVCGTPDDVVAALPALEGTVAIVPVYDGRYIHGPFVGLALSARPGHVVYVPVDDGRLRALVPLLQDPKHDKVLHDVKECMVLLKRRGVTLRGASFDTRLASFLVDPNKLIAEHHRLEAVAKEYLHRALPLKKDLTGGGKAQRALADVDVVELARYAAEAAHAVRDLHPLLHDALKDRGQLGFLHEVELPLSAVLAQMEVDGIAVDAVELKKIGEELAARLDATEKRIWALAGHELNIGSPKQLGEVLFDELKLPVIKRTKSGYSTDAEVLERLAGKHEICREILEYRRIDKLINTYTDVLQREVHGKTRRIHTTFQQTVGVTGRLITMDPDLQRTPIKTPEGQRIREAFVAQPFADGTPTVIVDADWSQIELRLLAHVSDDPLLVESFQKNLDVHRRTAAQIFKKAPESVTVGERNVGKTVNFATIYGQGAQALAQQLHVSAKDAKAYIDAYFDAYAGVRRWLEASIEAADEKGYATTLLGRKRIIPELKSRSPMDRGFGERVAANTPIQGSAADICKLAMLKIAARLPSVTARGRMILQVHDELLFEVPAADAEAVAALVKHEMEHVVELKVPLVAEVGIGKSWGEAH